MQKWVGRKRRIKNSNVHRNKHLIQNMSVCERVNEWMIFLNLIWPEKRNEIKKGGKWNASLESLTIIQSLLESLKRSKELFCKK